MARPFLTARWAHLINLTYAVDPALLLPHVPPGLELDVQDGKAFASVVAFDFLDTRVFGVSWPGFKNFPELNLRFYVKRGEQRGVVFIREYVPQRFVARMANWFYNEPYEACGMDSAFQELDDLVMFQLSLDVGGRTHTIRATGAKPAYLPPHDSVEHYFKEHQWGFGTSHGGKAITYEVEHPEWDIWPVQAWAVDADFGVLYGQEWRFLADETPISTLLAVGSEVAVYPQRTLADVDRAGRR